MDFRQLEYFKAIVDAGSLSGAARQLRMTQPPLSLAITKLEQELGVHLLERTAKGVNPTPAGRYLLENAERLLARRDRVKTTLALLGEGSVGELHIGVEAMVINEIVAEAMAVFLDEVPGASFSLKDSVPTDLLQGVLRGELDMAVVPFAEAAFSEQVREECASIAIAEIGLRVVVPLGREDEHHPNGRGWGRWILPIPQPGFTGMVEAVQTGLPDGVEILRVSSPATALPLVAAGLGVSITTERLARRQPGVALVDTPPWLAPMQTTAIWQRDSDLTPLMRRWLQTLRYVGLERERLSGTPGHLGAVEE